MKHDELFDEEIESLEVQIMAAARKVVEAGIWLIRNGFGKMMLLPYAAPSGCFWRCEYHPPGDPENPFYRYSTADLFKFLANHSGGSIRKNVSAEKLGQAIMVSVSEKTKAACSGSASIEMLRWLEDLEGALEDGFVPQAFHEYTEDFSKWQRTGLLRGEGPPMDPQPGYVPLAEYSRKAANAQADLREGHLYYEALQSASQLTLSPKSIEETISSDRIGNLLVAIQSDSTGSNDEREIGKALRSLFGRIVADAKEIDARQDVVAAPKGSKVSTNSPSDQVVKRGGRLLSAIHELHKAGYQRLRISAGWSADGSEWRCILLPASMTGVNGWQPHGDWPEYLSSQGKEYFGWRDCESDDARALANKILERFQDLVTASFGSDWAYAGWFTEMIGIAEHGELPAFYRNGLALKQCEVGAMQLPPTAGTYFQAERSGTGWPIISNEALTWDMLPLPNADENGVLPFCLSYDGYAGFRTMD